MGCPHHEIREYLSIFLPELANHPLLGAVYYHQHCVSEVVSDSGFHVEMVLVGLTGSAYIVESSGKGGVGRMRAPKLGQAPSESFPPMRRTKLMLMRDINSYVIALARRNFIYSNFFSSSHSAGVA